MWTAFVLKAVACMCRRRMSVGGAAPAAGVADALTHAAAAVGDGTVAVVTDGSLGSGLAFTGWAATIAESGGSSVAGLVRLLAERGLDESAASGLLVRAHLVQVPWYVPALTQALLREGLGLHPAVAQIVYAKLVLDLTSVAAAQRTTGADRPQVRAPADLDAHVAAVQRVVDVGALDEAVRSGVCEPIDFTHPSDLTSAQFYAGVDVAPSHVAADLDVLRPSRAHCDLRRPCGSAVRPPGRAVWVGQVRAALARCP
jgi:hypothetical protein